MTDETPTCSKPRLVLMGEFSAGKSTLSNILLDSNPLPMRVTATRLPPVIMTYGAPCAYAVRHDDTRDEIDLNNLETVQLEETARIEISMTSDVLQLCDIVDMPGISDPNMPQEMWENVIGPKDHVIWCTHATQAWRQSEAAIWNILRPQSSGINVLLITQFDKLQNERDKSRVIKRVERETDGLFNAIYPVALLDALKCGEDSDVWEQSGAAAFSEHIIKVLLGNVPVPAIHAQAAVNNDIRNTTALREQSMVPPIKPRRVSAQATATPQSQNPLPTQAEVGG
ncbi:MAG: dynamin family protein [Roseobacter sp.]